MIRKWRRTLSKIRLFVLMLLSLPFGTDGYTVGQNLEVHQVHPAWSPTEELIAFVAVRSDGDTRADLWTMNSDGSNAVNRTYTMVTFYNGLPKWSPNGDYLAFRSGSDVDSTRNDLLILDPTQNSIINLTSDISEGVVSPDFAWSPNSEYLAFLVGSSVGNHDLYVADVNKTFLMRLTLPESGFNHYPGWMSDDVVTVVNDDDILTAISIEDSSVTELLPMPISSYSISSDRQFITYMTTPDLAYYDLWLISLEDQHVVQLASNLFLPESDLVWSYQNDKFLFQIGCDDENSAIWQVAVTSQVQTNLTGCDNAYNFHPSWSPDGNHIVFQSDRLGVMSLWNMNADGSNPINLVVRSE
ncbi:MAG: PD40 domain-containing protein [Burkholderiales bacterium]|nr:PD40 domain-containing protein [Anaerolineae bacterium]